MNKERKTILPVRFATCIVAGLFAGLAASFVIGLSMDQHFESRALVASSDPLGPEIKLASVHAGMIARDLKALLTGDAESVREGTRFRVTSRGIEIIVVANSRYEAREIAFAAAGYFRGMEQEKRLADFKGEIRDFNDQELALIEDSKRIAELMNIQATKADFINFLEVSDLAKNGDPAAGALMKDEDFSRRFARYSEIAVKLGLLDAPGEPLSQPLKLLVEPQLADQRISGRYLPLLTMTCEIIGLLIGLAAAFTYGRTSEISPPPAFQPVAAPAPTTARNGSETPADW